MKKIIEVVICLVLLPVVLLHMVVYELLVGLSVLERKFLKTNKIDRYLATWFNVDGGVL